VVYFNLGKNRHRGKGKEVGKSSGGKSLGRGHWPEKSGLWAGRSTIGEVFPRIQARTRLYIEVVEGTPRSRKNGIPQKWSFEGVGCL